MDLSVVIPVYRSATFVVDRLTTLAAFLDRTPLDWEIIAVDDGSPDASATELQRLTHPRIKCILGAMNRGKFGALALGMAQAQGRCRVFTDADVPYDLTAIPYMVELVTARGFHLVIGDRTLPGSHYVQDMTPLRRLTTRLFTFFIRIFVTSGLFDTQCGLKALRGDVAALIFPALKETGFAGDVELLYVALKHNLEVKRVPVWLRNTGPSTVSPVRHGAAMLLSLFRIRRNFGRGCYDLPALRELSKRDSTPATTEPA